MTTEEKKEEYIVTARKWRPLKFADIVGQDHVSKTLKNAISTGRIHHAYLFCGPRGVGKTTSARVFAKAINCTSPVDFEPCNECESCRSVLDGRSLDIFEIDGASNNSVDDVRKLRESAKYPPTSGKYKMYIIDEVHMLSTSAFNALLKTLEEPPPHLMFVFATTEAHKLPATILSRCQRFDFRRMAIADIVGQLAFISEREKITIDEESLIAIAKKADGSMRDGQSIYDQVVAFCGTEIDYKSMANALHLIDIEFYFRISDAVKDRDVGEMYAVTRDVMSRGYDMKNCLGGLLEHFRNMMTVKVAAGIEYIESSDSYRERYRKEAGFFSKTDILRYMNLIAKTESELRFAPQPRLRFELTLVQLASMDSAADIGELLKEIRELKKNSGLNASSIKVSPSAVATESFKAEPVAVQPSVSMPVVTHIEATKNELTKDMGNAQPIAAAVPAVDASAARQAIVCNAKGLEENWTEFKKKYATAANDLFVLSFKDMSDVRFFDSEIVICIEDSFSFGSVDQKRNKLQDYIHEFYGKQVSVKVINGKYGAVPDISEQNNAISNNSDASHKENTNDSSSSPVGTDNKIINEYPVEQAIRDYFNATEI